MNYGVTPQGFIRKPYNINLQEMQALAQSAEYLGPTVDLSDESEIGAEIKLMAWAISNQWQLAEDVYYSVDIDVAEGVSLNRLTKLGLVEKKGPQKSGGYLKFTGKPGKPISIGTCGETEQGVVFTTTVHGQTDNTGIALIASECTVAGTAGNVPANSINKIKTPVADISAVTNPSPFVDGRGVETDPEQRDRFKSSHTASGSALDAIEAKVRNIPNVLEARGYENVENYADANGLPAGSIEFIVYGGDEDDIAKVILASKSGGVNTYGNVTRNIADSTGKIRTIRFSRPEVVPVYVRYVLSVNSKFNAGYETQIKAQAVDSINSLNVAATAYGWLICSLLQDIEGIENVKGFLGLASGAVTADKIVPGVRQILKADTARVVIAYE